MFNPFKKPPVEELIDNIKEAGTVTVPEQPRVEQPAYQIGKTESGKTTLRIGGEWSGGMLTMNDAGVLKLIEMLEATLSSETFTPEGHDGRGPG